MLKTTSSLFKFTLNPPLWFLCINIYLLIRKQSSYPPNFVRWKFCQNPNKYIEWIFLNVCHFILLLYVAFICSYFLCTLYRNTYTDIQQLHLFTWPYPKYRQHFLRMLFFEQVCFMLQNLADWTILNCIYQFPFQAHFNLKTKREKEEESTYKHIHSPQECALNHTDHTTVLLHLAYKHTAQKYDHSGDGENHLGCTDIADICHLVL